MYVSLQFAIISVHLYGLVYVDAAENLYHLFVIAH